MKKHIPNLFTCANLFCGCWATMYAVYDKFEPAACLIFIAAIFDVLDGLSARLLHVSNPIGKQLDSLADVVSFGLVPGIFMMMLMQKSIPSISHQNDFIGRGISLFPFIITIFSALRLAKFNIDTRQTDSFIGLPTPANTLLIISLPLILAHDQFNLKSIILNPYFILSLSALSSYLLVSNLPLFAIKLKSLSWSSNRYQYTLIIISIILLLTLKFVAIPLIILFYILLSLIKKLSEP